MRRLVTFAGIARVLDVPVERVRGWERRSAFNGFPSFAVRKTAKNGMPNAKHWDLDVVLTWHSTYRPHRGAKP